MEISVMDILAARDQRVATQKRLLAQFGKPLVCFTMNIAGPVKYTPAIVRGFLLGKRLLEVRFTAVHYEQSLSPTGCEGFFVVDLPARELKQICVMIEDSQPVCRLFDMDVLDADGRKLGREDLQLPGRKCLMCQQPAHVCSSTRAHSVAQLQAQTNLLLEMADDAAYIASLAYQALVQEVLTTPKPGLVDAQHNGSHRDMDLGLFLKSAAALRSYFYTAAQIGRAILPASESFRQLRQAGLQAEQAMLAATGGVNTHKGAVFTMGLLCAAAGASEDGILAACAAMTQGITQRDFANITAQNAQTAGQRLFVAHGITGIRGQAEAGFPAIGQVGLPVLRTALQAGLSLNDAGCAALLHILCATDDTNLIHRSDWQTAQQVRCQVRELLEVSPFPPRQVLEELDRQFVARNLSPGGSADLLAGCYFLHWILHGLA